MLHSNLVSPAEDMMRPLLKQKFIKAKQPKSPLGEQLCPPQAFNNMATSKRTTGKKHKKSRRPGSSLCERGEGQKSTQ